jgi:hypothetical protein
MSILLAALLLPLAGGATAQPETLAPAPQHASPDFSDPVKLFEGVCLSDQVKLAKDSVADQPYAGLSEGARNALGFANPPGGIPRIPPAGPLAATEVPNRILAILPQRTSFLLLPASGTGRYASSCAVLWKGNEYPKALDAAKRLAFGGALPAGTPDLTTPIRGLNWVVFTTKGMIVGAAEFGGWTVLRISPDLSTQEQSTP